VAIALFPVDGLNSGTRHGRVAGSLDFLTQGNLHHLILNKKDRAGMVHTIDIAFGRSLDDNKNSTSIVSAAWAIKYGLTRPIYKAADEP
jgi:hypothetical protein